MAESPLNNNICQYKSLFIFSWVLLYLIFPTWALPVSVAARAAVFFGLAVFFLISGWMMDRWFYALPVDKPVIVPPGNIAEHIKNNSWLFIVCCVAVILHVQPLSLPMLILGDEALHLTSGLWIYEHIDSSRHIIFQIIFWVFIGALMLVIKKRSVYDAVFNRFKFLKRAEKTNSYRPVFVLLVLFFFGVYFVLLRNITFFPGFIRYPHVIKLFYHIAYSAFGITHIGPRILQLAFYITGAVYLYRTILLFGNKETALIGASIYLFLPVVFVYAHLAEVSPGTVFFIILISFHFLRFIKEGNNRDLLLTSFFIGSGSMYKRSVFIMFFICTVYLIARSIINRDWDFKNHLKVMLISLVPIIPWMIIGKFFTWRNYKIIWSNFRPFEGKVFSFFMHIPQDISWILFVLFLFSAAFILMFRRNALSLFFGLLFLAYYFFLALDIANYSPRLAMTYYPAIAVYLAIFLGSVVDKIRWKHSFRIIYLCLSVYLISICTVPSLNAQFLSSYEFRKLKYFPGADAMKWVRENVKEGEKILTIRMMSSSFYRVKYGIDKNKIVDLWYQIEDVSAPDKLREFCGKHNISHIMFPYNAEYIKKSRPYFDIFEYLKNNPDKEFVEMVKYNIDENHIYIYRLKDN